MVICEVSFGCFATSMKKFTNAGASPRSSPLGLYGSSAAFRSTPGLIFLFTATEPRNSLTQRLSALVEVTRGLPRVFSCFLAGRKRPRGVPRGYFG
jgi:hypothetical protein